MISSTSKSYVSKYIQICIIFSFLNLTWILASPTGSAPDEFRHISSIYCSEQVATYGTIYTPDMREMISQNCKWGFQVEGKRLLELEIPSNLIELANCYRFNQNMEATCDYANLRSSLSTAKVISGQSLDYGEMGYSTVKPIWIKFYSLFKSDKIFFIGLWIKFFNVFLYSTLLYLFFVFFKIANPITYFISLFTIFNPLGLFLINSLNPSGTFIFTFTLLLFCILNFSNNISFITIPQVLLSILLTILLFNTRQESIIWIILLFFYKLSKNLNINFQKFFNRSLLLLSILLFSITENTTIVVIFKLIIGFFSSSEFGYLGWLDTAISAPLAVIFTTIFVVLVTWLIWQELNLNEYYILNLILSFFVVLSLYSLYRNTNLSDMGLQSRYFFGFWAIFVSEIVFFIHRNKIFHSFFSYFILFTNIFYGLIYFFVNLNRYYNLSFSHFWKSSSISWISADSSPFIFFSISLTGTIIYFLVLRLFLMFAKDLKTKTPF